MANTNNVKIVAFVGLPGTGKSEAVEHVCAAGIPKVYFGGVVLDAMRESGLDWTEENEKAFRESLREREGPDCIVNRIVSQIEGLIGAGQKRIVADGIYTWDEYKVMKRSFPGALTVVAIVSPKKLRHSRLAKRPVRPLTEEEANTRDWAQIEKLTQGGPIAAADYYIHNEGTIEELRDKIDVLIRKIEF